MSAGPDHPSIARVIHTIDALRDQITDLSRDREALSRRCDELAAERDTWRAAAGR